MTREEEIKQAEIKYSDDTLFDGCDYIGQVAKQEAFIAGAKWADATMIKKVCEWLRANIDLYTNTRRSLFSNYQEVYLTDNFETEFRKAMEDNYEN